MFSMLKRSFFTSGNVFYLVLAFTVFLYLMFSIGTRTIQLYSLQDKSGKMKGEISSLEQEHKRLTKYKEVVLSDAYVEKIAREELGMTREGEKAVIILHNPDTSSNAENTTGAPKDPRPYWRQWWDMLFGN
ncbi:MAG: septum formation initiator family protein [Dehalococcoidia bacterium]|nr:septum formation initiator family protein [Dehalococcoidia bacterium]